MNLTDKKALISNAQYDAAMAYLELRDRYMRAISAPDASKQSGGATTGMSSEIVNLTHEGSGDFTAETFTLQTQTHADEITFVYDGIPYLNRTKTNIKICGRTF